MPARCCVSCGTSEKSGDVSASSSFFAAASDLPASLITASMRFFASLLGSFPTLFTMKYVAAPRAPRNTTTFTVCADMARLLP